MTIENEIFAFGDNADYKCSSDQEKFVYKNAKIIKIENENKKKMAILKIFAGYYHCFALGEGGEIIGWGNFKSFRLTSDYGDTQSKSPKFINLFNKQGTAQGNREVYQEGKNNQYDERHILVRLSNKQELTSFREVIWIIEKTPMKYWDEELISRDSYLQKTIFDGIAKISESSPNLNTESYIHYDKLLTLRVRAINAPLRTNEKKHIPEIISNNINEIEKIMTMFYFHPCYFIDYFEPNSTNHISNDMFLTFLEGIKPLFTDLQLYSQKSESLDNIIYLSFFNILIDYDIKLFGKDLDKMYTKQNSFAEYMIERYFYNNFDKSLLLDIFEKSLRDLFNLCKSHITKNLKNKNNNPNVNKIVQLFSSIKNVFINPSGIQTEKVCKKYIIYKGFLQKREYR